MAVFGIKKSLYGIKKLFYRSIKLTFWNEKGKYEFTLIGDSFFALPIIFCMRLIR